MVGGDEYCHKGLGWVGECVVLWCCHSGVAVPYGPVATRHRYPTEVEWPTFIDGFIRSLGLVENPYTTQAIHP